MPTRANTLVELYHEACAGHADRPALATRVDDGWHWLSYRDLERAIDDMRAGLADLGVTRGDRVALIMGSRPEWPALCYAVAGLGAVLVPMYEAQQPSDWRYILEDSRARVAVVGARALDAVLAVASELPALEHIVGADQPATDALSLAALRARGARRLEPVTTPAPDDVAEIVYTSGTTGRPKGVLLTHGGITSDVRAMQQVFPIGPGETAVSFLPWAHVLGQIGELHHGLAAGVAIAICTRLERLLEDVREVQPTLLIAVPAVFNRIYVSVMRQVGGRSRLVRRLFRDGVAAAARKSHGQAIGLWPRVELGLDRRLIFSKVRERLGGRLKWVFCGGAALGREVAELIDALGITVHEGYGLTETSCTVSLQPRGARKIGTAGKPLPGVRIDIDTTLGERPGEGEIVVYGPVNMRGYHGLPDETAAAFTPAGGVRTGDLGYFDQDGYLVISGRIKEQYKLENGKYVMPITLEDPIRLSPYIREIMVYGANRPYNIALVVPDREAVAEWAAQHPGQPVRELLLGEVRERTRDLPRFQVPRDVAVLPEDPSPDNGLLTPSLKLRRARIAARYADLIEALYAPGAAAEAAPAP